MHGKNLIWANSGAKPGLYLLYSLIFLILTNFPGMMKHLKVRHPSEFEKYLGQKEKFLKLKEKFQGKLRR